MIIIATSALVLRIVIEQIIRITITQNESSACANLKLISAALENYAFDHRGIYPASFSNLTQSKPAYLDKDYITQSSSKGYSYSCPRLELSGYACYASPLRCKLTGKMVYTVTTGGSLISEDCSRKE